MNMITRIEDDDLAQIGSTDRRKARRTALILLPLLVLGGIGTRMALADDAPIAAPPPPTVSVATPLEREITEWDDYVGRFAPSRTVEIRPRVSGEITGVHFRDGEIVRAGQLLFTIDARPFAASLAEARAGVASARSELSLAGTELARAQRLITDEAISQSEVDALRARVQAAQAALAAAEARVRTRSLDVGFTQVRAPISGRVSDRRIDPGNQVSGSEGTTASLLTTINALDPIYFSFDGSEALFLKTQRARQPGSEPATVEVRLQDEADYRWKGRLDFTDNGLDAGSGTIRARAVIPNPGNFLTPGMFGNMRLASGGTVKALLVPDEAIQTDQARKILLVVDGKGAVSAKPVTLGPLVSGLRVIRSGVTATDRVVIEGAQSAMPGATVQAKSMQIAMRPAGVSPVIAPPLAGEATFAR